MFYIAELTQIAPLGQGSFGEVHLCNDRVHGQVAAKFFFRTKFNSLHEWTTACKDALSEAQNMKALEHRNVVPIYQVLQSPQGDSFVIVMQFCDHGSMKSVAESNQIDLTVAKRFIRDAGIGACYIHNKGFLHRDIKPDNIFRTSSGEVKIGDFGFVTDKLIFGFAGGCGTPEYIAPEVMTSLQCSALTDVYSLGVTFLHMTHGDHWFYRTGKHAILKAIPFNGQMWRVVGDDYFFLPHLPAEWRTAIRKMTNPNPAKRIQSMEAAVDTVSRLPVVREWICEVTPNRVSWTRQKGERRLRVEWTDYFTPADAWIAWSENSTGGQKRSRGKSDPKDKPIKRYRALQELFSTWQS